MKEVAWGERVETEQGGQSTEEERERRSLLEAESYNKTAGFPHEMTKQEQRQKGGRSGNGGQYKEMTAEISYGLAGIEQGIGW